MLKMNFAVDIKFMKVEILEKNLEYQNRTTASFTEIQT